MPKHFFQDLINSRFLCEKLWQNCTLTQLFYDTWSRLCHKTNFILPLSIKAFTNWLLGANAVIMLHCKGPSYILPEIAARFFALKTRSKGFNEDFNEWSVFDQNHWLKITSVKPHSHLHHGHQDYMCVSAVKCIDVLHIL